MPKFISVIRDNEIIIKFLKDFKSQTIVNLAICSTLVKENLRFQTIRSTDHVGCPGIVFKDPIFIAGYVLDASIKSDLVRSKTFYQFHVEFEKKSKDARRLKDDYRFGYSGLSMCSTFQSFDEKLESYFLRDPQDFSGEFFYNRKPDNLIYYSSEQYFDKDHQEIKIPALRPVYLPDTKEVVHNEVHILAGLNHVENVFINSEDLMRGFLFRKAFSSRDIEPIHVIRNAHKLKKLLNLERQKLLAYLKDDDHLKSSNPEYEDQRKSLENCHEIEGQRIKIALEKYCNLKIKLKILEFIQSNYYQGNFEPQSSEMISSFFNKGEKTDGAFDPNNPENKKRWVENQIKKLKQELDFIDTELDECRTEFELSQDDKDINSSIKSLKASFDELVSKADKSLAEIKKSSDYIESFERIKSNFIEEIQLLIKLFKPFTDDKISELLNEKITKQLEKKVEIKIYSIDPEINFLEAFENYEFDLSSNEIVDLLFYSILDQDLDLIKFCLEFKKPQSQLHIIESLIKSDAKDERSEKLKDKLLNKISFAKPGDEEFSEMLDKIFKNLNESDLFIILKYSKANLNFDLVEFILDFKTKESQLQISESGVKSNTQNNKLSEVFLREVSKIECLYKSNSEYKEKYKKIFQRFMENLEPSDLILLIDFLIKNDNKDLIEVCFEYRKTDLAQHLSEKNLIDLLKIATKPDNFLNNNNFGIFKSCLDLKKSGSKYGILDSIIKSQAQDENTLRLKKDLSEAIGLINKLQFASDKISFFEYLINTEQELIDDGEHQKFFKKKFEFCFDFFSNIADSAIESPFREDQERLKNVISLLSSKVSDRDDRALFYKHLLSFALSPDDEKKEFLERKFEFCLDALPVELKKEFLQYCNIEENIAQLIADETKLNEEQKIQISKQHQSLGVFKRVKRSFINTSIKSTPSSQFQSLQGEAVGKQGIQSKSS